MIQNELQEWVMSAKQDEPFHQINRLPIIAASDIMKRSENQDRALMLKLISSKGVTMVGVLCDGMGGMAHGAECASLAIAAFTTCFIHSYNLNTKERIWKSVNAANKFVWDKYSGYAGTTLSAFAMGGEGNIEAVNVGDSRIYIIFDDKLKQVTIDDTIQGQLGKPGLSNMLLQHIGIKDLQPYAITLQRKDVTRIILTTDGAHFIEHKTLESLLVQNRPPVQLANNVLCVARWCGGSDNASILLMKNFTLSERFSNTESWTVWDTNRLYAP